MREVRIALVAGLALLLAALAWTLTRAPMSVAGANRALGAVEEPIATTSHSSEYCQAQETLPAGTSAIRVWIDAAQGPRVHVAVYSGGRLLTSGTRGSNWIGGSFTVPVRPLARTVAGATVCVWFALRDEVLTVQGNPAPASVAAHEGARALKGRIWIEYLRPGTRSWASLAGSIVREIGLGRTPAMPWIAFLVLGLMVALAALCSRLVLRDLR